MGGLLPEATLNLKGLMSSFFFRNNQIVTIPTNNKDVYYELTSTLSKSNNLSLKVISSSTTSHQLLSAVFITGSLGFKGEIISKGGSGSWMEFYIDKTSNKIYLRSKGSQYATISVESCRDENYILGVKEYNGDTSNLELIE